MEHGIQERADMPDWQDPGDDNKTSPGWWFVVMLVIATALIIWAILM